jgi:hypothetical protein
MTYLPNQDYLIEVQRGNVPGESMVHKFGRNDAVPNGSWAFVNLLGFTAWPLSAATTVRVKAGGNAADTAAGAGAREVTVQGINASLAESSETIATAGASASAATSTSFWRVHRAWVSSAGTYGAANTAAIDIENSGGGTDLIQIATEEGQSQFAGWTVPTGKTAYLLHINVTVDALKPSDIRLFTRANMNDTSAPVSAKRLKLYFDGVSGNMDYHPVGPELVIPELTDIWFEAEGDGALTEVAVDFELLVIDDE